MGMETEERLRRFLALFRRSSFLGVKAFMQAGESLNAGKSAGHRFRGRPLTRRGITITLPVRAGMLQVRAGQFGVGLRGNRSMVVQEWSIGIARVKERSRASVCDPSCSCKVTIACQAR